MLDQWGERGTLNRWMLSLAIKSNLIQCSMAEIQFKPNECWWRLILSGCMNISAMIIDWIEMGSPMTHSGKHALHVRYYAKNFFLFRRCLQLFNPPPLKTKKNLFYQVYWTKSKGNKRRLSVELIFVYILTLHDNAFGDFPIRLYYYPLEPSTRA